MSYFGKTWGRVQTPVEVPVMRIEPELQPQIGLSAIQLDNLGLERSGAPPSQRDLLLRIEENVERLPGPIEYPSIRARGKAETELKVYNAFGHLFVEGGVCLSRGAADKLGVKKGDIITIL